MDISMVYKVYKMMRKSKDGGTIKSTAGREGKSIPEYVVISVRINLCSLHNGRVQCNLSVTQGLVGLPREW